MTQDEIDKLERAMEVASENLKKNRTMGYERPYGQAYAALVKAGLRRPLRSKYRGGIK